MIYQGILQKMRTQDSAPVSYSLPVGSLQAPMNDLIGKRISLCYTGNIFCLNCGSKTAKSFSQGYCFRCFKALASNDMCILKPETCHFHLGTCREPAWGEANCFRPHVVYLANSSGLKVGITRQSQIPTRWMDQGARQALPILQVNSRYQAGLAEVIFANHISDKTQWQRLLKEDAPEVDLAMLRDELLRLCAEELRALQARFPDAIRVLDGHADYRFAYPVRAYPTKVKALNLDTQPEVTGVLQGIKGQYLILDTGVINIRKFGGYEVVFGAEDE